jgi:hypothetical protein
VVIEKDTGDTTKEEERIEEVAVAMEEASDGDDGGDPGENISISISIDGLENEEPLSDTPSGGTGAGAKDLDRLWSQGNSVTSCSWSNDASSAKGEGEKSIQMTVRLRCACVFVFVSDTACRHRFRNV